jgi:hypothetical protein
LQLFLRPLGFRTLPRVSLLSCRVLNELPHPSNDRRAQTLPQKPLAFVKVSVCLKAFRGTHGTNNVPRVSVGEVKSHGYQCYLISLLGSQHGPGPSLRIQCSLGTCPQSQRGWRSSLVAFHSSQWDSRFSLGTQWHTESFSGSQCGSEPSLVCQYGLEHSLGSQ